jgi:hypothetical protein
MASSPTTAEHPQQRVLRLLELRVEIFQHLGPGSLAAVALVNRAWSATAIPLLWRSPPPKALENVPAKRCHVYNAAVRHAAVRVGLKRQLKKAWTLPRLRALTLIYSHDASDSQPAMQALLSQYAANLSRVAILCENQQHRGLYWCRRCEPHNASGALMQHIARCRDLIGLTMSRLVTAGALESLRADVADPFERLRKLDIRIVPNAVPILRGMIRNVTHLWLVVAVGRGTGVFSAISRLQNLQALMLDGCWGGGYEDLSVLGRLTNLQSLKIVTLALQISDTQLAALLTQLPRLQILNVESRSLSFAAYHMAANKCPGLRCLSLSPTFKLPSPQAFSRGPQFPKLEQLSVDDIEVDGGLEGYA